VGITEGEAALFGAAHGCYPAMGCRFLRRL